MEYRLEVADRSAVEHLFENEDPTEQYYACTEVLLWRNEPLKELLNGSEAQIIALSSSQKALMTIVLLLGEVPNGGLLQFIWNQPQWVDEVEPALHVIGCGKLAAIYQKSLESITANSDTYAEFRRAGTLEAYSECASIYTFEEFDSAFFEEEAEIQSAMVAFVKQHLEAFVVW